MKRSKFNTYLLALAGITLTISMILFPESAFEAAQDGLAIWWNVVFPALLPFFIDSELLMGLGVVNFMGSLLEPLMRPLFNVPGEGSFVLAMGLASGYPIGAILTAKLRRKNIINKAEAERLISMANTADPLFMFGAVAVGFFHDVKLGALIALAHYCSALAVGFTMRFYKPKAPKTLRKTDTKKFFLTRAVQSLTKARAKDGRPFGELLGDAVKGSVNSLLMIGGFMIFFSVIIKIATVSGLLNPIKHAISTILATFGLSTNLSQATASGIFEISLGTKLCSTAIAPITQQLIISGVIIAWSGFSVHGQVAAIIHDTDINLKPYIIARIWQAFLAGLFTWFLLLRSPIMETGAGFLKLPATFTVGNTLMFGVKIWATLCFALLVLGFITQLFRIPIRYILKRRG